MIDESDADLAHRIVATCSSGRGSPRYTNNGLALLASKVARRPFVQVYHQDGTIRILTQLHTNRIRNRNTITKYIKIGRHILCWTGVAGETKR